MKYCIKCGAEIDEGVKFCPNCGAQQDGGGAPKEEPKPAPGNYANPDNYNRQINNGQVGGGYYYSMPSGGGANMLAIIGFILSFFVSIAGLILGILGLKQANRENGNGKGFAIAAIAISATTMFIYLMVFIIVLVDAAKK